MAGPVGGPAQPQFGQRTQIGLVLDHEGQGRGLRGSGATAGGRSRRERRGQSGPEIRLPPAQVGGVHHRRRPARHQPRHRDRQPGRPQSLHGDARRHLRQQLRQMGEHRAGLAAPVRRIRRHPGPHPAAQIDRADGEMVDADLRPSPAGPRSLTASSLPGRPRPLGAARPVSTSRPARSNSSTSGATPARVSPIRAATPAREAGPSAATARSTLDRLRRRMPCWVSPRAAVTGVSSAGSDGRRRESGQGRRRRGSEARGTGRTRDTATGRGPAGRLTAAAAPPRR